MLLVVSYILGRALESLLNKAEGLLIEDRLASAELSAAYVSLSGDAATANPESFLASLSTYASRTDEVRTARQ